MPNRATAERTSPQGLRPEIARIVEALARAAVRREDRRAAQLAAAGSDKTQIDDA